MTIHKHDIRCNYCMTTGDSLIACVDKGHWGLKSLADVAQIAEIKINKPLTD